MASLPVLPVEASTEGLRAHQGDGVTPVGETVRGQCASLKRIDRAGDQACDRRRGLNADDGLTCPRAWSAARGRLRPTHAVTAGAPV